MAQSGVQGNCTTLGETGEKNIFGSNSACFFLRNKLFNFRLRRAYARSILLCAYVKIHNVIP